MRLLRFGSSAFLLLTLAATGCDEDNSSQSNASTADASVDDSGTRSTASGGRGGSGGSTAGRAGSTANAGRGGIGGGAATAGVGAATAGVGARGATAGGSATAGSATAGSAGNVAAAGTGGVSGAAGNGGAAGTTAIPSLNDAQIASVALTANMGEVEQNTVAAANAQRATVLLFAQGLVAMHTLAQERENALLGTLGLAPADNATSAQLRDASSQIVTRLRAAATGTTFDTVYVTSQIEVHQMVLDLIDNVLIPQVAGAALRTELTTIREEVRMHLADARRLADTLDNDTDAGTL